MQKSTSSEFFTSKDTTEWPPWCCVPAMVHNAVFVLENYSLDKRQLALDLNTFVPKSEENAWGLKVTDKEIDNGVTIDKALRFIPKVLEKHMSSLTFRHIMFNLIPYHMYDTILEEAEKKKYYVGVGFDFGVLSRSGKKAKHLCRVRYVDNENVRLVDPSRLFLSTTARWSILSEAVFAIQDGFWIFGKSDQLNFSII